MNAETILAELKKAGYDPSRVACKLQISYSEVVNILAGVNKPPIESSRKDLAPYQVAVKRSDRGWGDRNAVLAARRAYNAGTHELVQHQKDGWTWLYSVPRKDPVPPRKYFNV